MCTVTFVPLKKGVCITSNRDEKTARQKAIPPQKYIINNKTITFPKDPKAGGTWFAHDNKNILVLLNGAMEKHLVKSNYKKSRGLIVLELIASNNINKEWEKIDLKEIEPFTLVYYNGNHLFQFQWNEIEKSTIQLDPSKEYIWSSSTLYTKEKRSERVKWFNTFLENTKSITSDSLINFHQFTESDNKDFGLQINHDDYLKTVSITQCIYSDKQLEDIYIDLT